jgi:hypothetical protein
MTFEFLPECRRGSHSHPVCTPDRDGLCVESVRLLLRSLRTADPAHRSRSPRDEVDASDGARKCHPGTRSEVSPKIPVAQPRASQVGPRRYTSPAPRFPRWAL